MIIDDMGYTPQFDKLYEILKCIRDMGFPAPQHILDTQLNLHLGARRQWEFPWVLLNGQFNEGKSVLNVGCGCTPLDIFLAQNGCTVYGIDVRFEKHRDLEYQNYLRDVVLTGDCAKLLPQLQYRYASGDIIPFEDMFFDRVISTAVLKHMSEDVLVSTITEMHRVLKDDGLAVITLDKYHHPHRVEPQDYIYDLLLENGFVHVNTKSKKYKSLKSYLYYNKDNTSHNIQIFDTLPYGLVLTKE